MRTREELHTGCAKLLKDLRREQGLSMKKMASHLYVDDHTWARYESGESYIPASDLIYILSHLGGNALPLVLAFLYPSKYPAESCEDKRQAIAHYFTSVATPSEVSAVYYILTGPHGSSRPAQFAELSLIDHLPMDYRVAIAELIDTFWRISESRGELIAPTSDIPNLELFRECLSKGMTAAQSNTNTYETIHK